MRNQCPTPLALYLDLATLALEAVQLVGLRIRGRKDEAGEDSADAPNVAGQDDLKTSIVINLDIAGLSLCKDGWRSQGVIMPFTAREIPR